MNVTIEKSADLVEAAHHLAGAMARRPVSAAGGGVLLDSVNDGLVLTTTNLVQAARVRVPATVDTPGRVVVAAARFFEIADAVGEGRVTIAAAAPSRLMIRSVAARWTLPQWPVDAFPLLHLDTPGALRLSAVAFSRALRAVTYAVAADLAYSPMRGVHLRRDGDDVLQLEATNGHCLAVATCPILGGAWTGAVIVPATAFKLISGALRAAPEVDLSFTDGTVVLRADRVTASSRLLEGTFPVVESIFSKPRPLTVTLDVAALTAAVERVGILASEERSRPVVLTFAPPGSLVVTGSSVHGESEVILPVDWPGPQLTLTVSSGYVLDALAALDAATVALSIAADPLEPLLFTAESRAVIMPMRST